MMSKGAAKVRLAVAAGLFLAWIGWLAYLVFTTHNPVILARPQFLVADLWVCGHIDGDNDRPGDKMLVREVLWTRDKIDQSLVEKTLTVWDLPFARKAQGWAGPRDYLVPLKKVQEGKKTVFHLTPLPPSPGYPPLNNPPAYTVRLISAGKNKDAVGKLIAQVAGLDLAVAKEKVNKPGSIILKNLPPRDFEDIKKKFDDLDAVISRPLAEESRIYPATPQVLEQLKEIHMK
jgi:ribosomal protein L7/L12